ncbi:MAG TPA: metalloregulator ArsR/SmtB family transcription factor [Candidatus Izemoplasmatales bacterium]|nr:metalloregulator ArsR/SmtB family transcription factor [Candidatus Izemoplasmatales bacterium]
MENQMAEAFRALSDPNRLLIMKLLLEGESCGCTLINSLPISQPTLSYHLRMLSASGLVTSRKEGTWNKHFVNKEKIKETIKYLEELLETKKTCKL